LASELHENLVRFDMSEYAEKHTVSKFIGSPAGYVGYDDGGLLTDAVRKNPGCVLLLDEIEKAHQDIYNLLLQIMDYGTLTDSRGQKADFRGVVLIMTSNAGARFASQAAVGFSRKPNPGGVMEGEAKKVFAPEFLNRLTSTVVFNALDEDMAIKVLDSKIRDLSSMLQGKSVTLEVTEVAKKALLSEGFSPEYGAREIERVVDSRLKPLLVKEILFGKLKKGGKATVGYKDKEYTLVASRK
ncbi:MAG: AAA family ATPase, partial [Bacteroidales bacterium]|nr:AAA family ATPase [Bacteroidales bacterium]